MPDIVASMMDDEHRGFTLLELAIVLIIIGLVVGAVLVGRDLIAASQVRKQLAQIESFKTAVNAFKAKYNCLPGDCTNATAFFGVTDSNGNPIYNGDGDGQISDYFANWFEYLGYFQFWTQLADAALIPGPYVGYPYQGSNGSSPGPNPPANVPASVIGGSNGAVGVQYQGGFGWQDYGGLGWSGNAFQLGAVNAAHDNVPIGVLLTPAEAQAIDNKMDDGVPGAGTVQTISPGSGAFSTNCATTNNASSALYEVAYSGVACQLSIRGGF